MNSLHIIIPWRVSNISALSLEHASKYTLEEGLTADPKIGFKQALNLYVKIEIAVRAFPGSWFLQELPHNLKAIY